MSADTTVVIAAYRFPYDSELSYTADVIGAAEDFTESMEDPLVMERAHLLFLKGHHQWFHGKGGLSRAKQFANILAEETRENGILEYEDRPIIEIGEDRVYTLSRRGNRKPSPAATDPEFLPDLSTGYELE